MVRSRPQRHFAASLAAGVFLVTTIADAAIYKSIDTDGTAIYTDRFSPEAERIECSPLSVVEAEKFSSPPVQTASSIASTTNVDREVSIVTPVQDATLRSNAGTLAVELSVDPRLQPTHAITILLDGKPLHVGAQSMTLTLANVDRGTHALQAMIVDAAGREVATSASATLHLKRVSILIAPNR